MTQAGGAAMDERRGGEVRRGKDTAPKSEKFGESLRWDSFLWQSPLMFWDPRSLQLRTHFGSGELKA